MANDQQISDRPPGEISEEVILNKIKDKIIFEDLKFRSIHDGSEENPRFLRELK